MARIKSNTNTENNIVNCLRPDKTIIVRFIKKQRGSISDPTSFLYGGLADTSTIRLVVPRLNSGVLRNPLTDAEKEFFEYTMGLPENAMSVYNRDNNYWTSGNPGCINSVTLSKVDTILNLGDAADYIRYKILLLNSDMVCPSIQELEDHPKPTYRFVIVDEVAEAAVIGNKANLKFECYTEYGKYKDNADVLRTIIRLMDGKKIASDTRIEHLQAMVARFIDEDPKRFKLIISDKLLETKAIIDKAVEKGIIANRNNLYYLREGSVPLCEDSEDPRYTTAAKYLASPQNQDLRDSIIAQID